MKKNLIKFSKIAWLMIMALAIVTTSCKKDDDDDDTPDDPIIVLDGVYIKGDATALADYDSKGLMKATRNEVNQEDRAELLELYIAVKATGGFNITTVAGSEKITYGPGDDFAVVAEADLDGDEPRNGLQRGTIKATDTKFTVPEDGLYHVIFDTQIGMAAIAKVDWGIIGGATPGGWGENTVFAAPAFDLNTMTYTIESVTLTEDAWKFRYSNGWKIILDADVDLGGGVVGVKVNTNYGGATFDAMIPGGDNIANTKYYNYKMTITYTLGSAFAVTMEEESEPDPLPSFPETMFLVGAGTAYAWETPGTVDAAIMHKLAGGGDNEGIFWKILHLEAAQGFKVSAADWNSPNLGFAEVDEYDTDGVEITENGGNMDVAVSGMYMVVLDLRNDMTKVSVIAPEVYGMGDAFGSWDEDVAANLFQVDNAAKTLISPALPGNGNLRMYVHHAWIGSWWNSEFNIYGTEIQYRNDGGDQEAVPATAGQVATLHFDDNTGSIQ
ncbi:MAG: SusF/SusE family outer membrane protein [Bacteroidales bacterium]|nr:SusF/SusE family outer membrane protein [Bacteroidales bacterium]